MAVRRMYGLTRPISYTSTTPHHEEWLQGNYLQELNGVREVRLNGKLERSVAVIFIVTIFGKSHGVPLLVFWAVLQKSEARLIKSTILML